SWWDWDLNGALLELEPLGNDVTYMIKCSGLIDCFFGGPITFRVISNGVDEIYSGSPATWEAISITEPGHYRAYMEGSALDNPLPVTIQFTIGEAPELLITPFALLGGAWDSATALMRDDLRSNNEIPTERVTYD